MITEIIGGDINIMPEDPRDIIVGMNTTLDELTSIVLPQSWRAAHHNPFSLGSVLSFQLDRKRHLHMIICHRLGDAGWVDADRYVRIGMDYLWLKYGNNRDFSIVQIGAGRIGIAGEADVNKIRAAMAASFLPISLYILESPQPVHVRIAQLSAPQYWNPLTGVEQK